MATAKAVDGCRGNAVETGDEDEQVLVVLISNDKKIMGDYRNGKLARILGRAATALMTVAAIVLFAFAHGRRPRLSHHRSSPARFELRMIGLGIMVLPFTLRCLNERHRPFAVRWAQAM